MSRPYDRRPADPFAPAGRQSLRNEIRSGFRRALGLTALGTAIPGAGLTQTRSRKLGWLLLSLFLLGMAGLAYYVLSNGVTASALELVADPGLLRIVTIACIVVGLLWSGSIILTAIQARPARLDRARTRTLAVFTSVMVFLIAGTSVKAAEYATITKDTVAEVFGTGAKPGEGAEVVKGEDPWAQTPRVNFLLLGSDAGKNRESVRTDSMIVASVDTKTGRTALVSLPRNLQGAPLSPDSPLLARYPSGHFGGTYDECAQGANGCMLTNLWREAEFFEAKNPGSYPGDDSPGRTEIRGAIQEITGLKIDQVVIIDLKGFQQLIDAMGGLDINVKLSGFGTKLPIGGHSDGNGGIVGVVKEYFEPGRRHLDGWHSLWYARTRAADSDTYRQARQRCVVQAIVDQVNPAAMVGKYPELAKIAKDNIYTDIPVENLGAFVELVERIQKGKQISSVALTAKQGIHDVDPDWDLVRSLVKKGLKAPKPKPTPTTTPSSSGSSTPTKTGTKTATPTPTQTPYEEC